VSPRRCYTAGLNPPPRFAIGDLVRLDNRTGHVKAVRWTPVWRRTDGRYTGLWHVTVALNGGGIATAWDSMLQPGDVAISPARRGWPGAHVVDRDLWDGIDDTPGARVDGEGA
jgi:hypothetical protein